MSVTSSVFVGELDSAQHPVVSGSNIPGGLTLFTEWVNAFEVRIVVAGQIDMSNADLLTEQVFRRAGNCKRLVLDLREVTFFACAGYSALCHIDDRCNSANVRWAVEPARVVSRVLEICDPLKTLPLSIGTHHR